jgi:Tfp pilus assembly protein PilO
MSGINLAQNAHQEVERKKRKRSRKGTFLVVLVLVLLFAVWGALVWYEGVLSGEISALEDQVLEQEKSIAETELNKVADLYFRIEAVDRKLSESVAGPQALLGMVSSAIEPGVVLSRSSYEESKGEIVLVGRAGEYVQVVRQLVALKRNEEVRDVSVESLKRAEDGQLEFSLLVETE